GVDDPVERLLAMPEEHIKDAHVAAGFVMMQGTVDAILIEDEQIAIIDYKTDRGNEDLDTLAARYARQVSAYAIALERAWKRPVSQGWLYFTARSEAVCVWPPQSDRKGYGYGYEII
ncbi:PD-(D/E)XK nuclease family protein, partial [Ferroacidibacillus organovorans]